MNSLEELSKVIEELKTKTQSYFDDANKARSILKTLNQKFPRSLESLNMNVDDILKPMGYSEPEIKMCQDSLDKKASRIYNFVTIYIQTKDELLAENRKIQAENKSL